MSNKPTNADDALEKITLNKKDYPSNSFKSKSEVEQEPVGEKKLEKIVKGNVTKKKKGLGKKITELFVGEDVGNVSQYILYDVLLPAAKNTIWEMVSSGFEMMLFGETRTNKGRVQGIGKTFVNYAGFSNKTATGYRANERRETPAARTQSRHSFDDLVFDSRADAVEVLNQLVFLINEYDQATVADLYDLVGVSGDFTDVKYGWTTLEAAQVRRARGGGFIIDFPKATPLD